MTEVIWLHDDALRHWYGNSPAVYVFDDEKLRHEQWSLKRIGFVYECLLELPVELRRGDPVAEVLAFQQQHHAAAIRTMDTPDPGLREQIKRMQTTSLVAVQTPEPFVQITGKLELKRFSKYWAKAEPAIEFAIVK